MIFFVCYILISNITSYINAFIHICFEIVSNDFKRFQTINN
nr:MAG TPA: hypothetical protein [Caudoviricetes sp.]